MTRGAATCHVVSRGAIMIGHPEAPENPAWRGGHSSHEACEGTAPEEDL
jgi:hypothetical protein